jgi:uncharacterized Zn-finger protein
MRPRLKYFIQCDEVRNEQGKFSAIGIFDTIYSLFFPASHPRFFLLLGFTGAEGNYKVDIYITSPDGKQIAELKGEVRIQNESHVTNAVFCFEKFPLVIPGRYTITIFLEGDFLAEYPFFARPPFDAQNRTPEEIAELMKRPDIVKSATAEVSCPKCGTQYRFQYNLDPRAPVAPGSLALPPGEFFACAACGTHIPLTQLRENLSRIVGVPQSWLQGPPGHNPPDVQPGDSQGGDSDA